jgi:hypothetical protein
MTSNNLAIFTYTRAQAIADGVLIDVSKLAREAGFRYPVALTAGVWAECVAVPEGVTGQDETGRLWDILTMLRFAIARQKGDAQRIDFALHVRNDNREGDPPLVSLYALCGPGDNGEPVITVLLPGED